MNPKPAKPLHRKSGCLSLTPASRSGARWYPMPECDQRGGADDVGHSSVSLNNEQYCATNLGKNEACLRPYCLGRHGRQEADRRRILPARHSLL
jgi:hypothetical protein